MRIRTLLITAAVAAASLTVVTPVAAAGPTGPIYQPPVTHSGTDQGYTVTFSAVAGNENTTNIYVTGSRGRVTVGGGSVCSLEVQKAAFYSNGVVIAEGETAAVVNGRTADFRVGGEMWVKVTDCGGTVHPLNVTLGAAPQAGARVFCNGQVNDSMTVRAYASYSGPGAAARMVWTDPETGATNLTMLRTGNEASPHTLMYGAIPARALDLRFQVTDNATTWHDQYTAPVPHCYTDVDNLAASPGFSGTDADTLRLYGAGLGREPDLDGAVYWTRIRQSGQPAEVIAEYMTDSEEWHDNYDGTSDSDYVTTLYRNVLGRDHDQVGLDYWISQLDSQGGTLSRGTVIYWISQGHEYTDAHLYGGL